MTSEQVARADVLSAARRVRVGRASAPPPPPAAQPHRWAEGHMKRRDSLSTSAGIVLVVLAFSMISCGRGDRTAFEHAEATYNSGAVAEAQILYAELVRTYPTSRWRQIAESQMAKCREIIQLQAEASKLQSCGAYREAISVYSALASLHPAVVDTSDVLPSLRAKAAVQDSVVRATAAAQERDFLNNLVVFLFALNGYTDLMTDYVSSADEITGSYNLLLASGIDEFWSAASTKAYRTHISDLYRKIKDPPPRYSRAVAEIEKSYASYNELNYTLTHLENYSRMTLRQQIARLEAEISASITDLDIYMPKEALGRRNKQ
jgi:hypothetical protein